MYSGNGNGVPASFQIIAVYVPLKIKRSRSLYDVKKLTLKKRRKSGIISAFAILHLLKLHVYFYSKFLQLSETPEDTDCNDKKQSTDTETYENYIEGLETKIVYLINLILKIIKILFEFLRKGCNPDCIVGANFHDNRINIDKN